MEFTTRHQRARFGDGELVRRICTLLAVAGLLLIGSRHTLAADALAEAPQPAKPIYQPAGAPADPKVAVRWNQYHDYAQATEILKQLAAAYPQHCRLQSLGKSFGNREMWVLTLSDFATGKEDDKPGFWIDGGIHANELQASEVVLYTAWYLAEMQGRSPTVARLLKERVFYLLPMLSPDSRDAHIYKPNTTHSPRSGQRPVDDDLDGLVDEDGPDDLDGDGNVTQMRIADPHGKFKPHPEFPNLMVAVKPGERGEFSLLGEEGFDNDGDGDVNEDGDGSYDPNRDWGWNWQPAGVQGGAYRYPFSIGENRLAAEFVAAHLNIAGAQSYHNTGGMILRGPGAKNEQLRGEDVAVFDQLGKQGEQMLPGYRYMNIAHELYETHGNEIDWFFGLQGIFAFTTELNTPFNLFRKAEGGEAFAKAEQLHRFDKYLLLGDGVVAWRDVEHPQYGKVQVGGLKKTWNRQPPSFLLEEECHRNMAFTLYHADEMPLVRIDGVTVQQLPGGLSQVTAIVINPKITPTHSAHDVARKITPPDRVKITGDKLKVLVALTSRDSLFTEPSEQKRHPAEVELPTLAGQRPTYVRWIVQGAGPYTVSVRSVKGGVATASTAAAPGTGDKP